MNNMQPQVTHTAPSTAQQVVTQTTAVPTYPAPAAAQPQVQQVQTMVSNQVPAAVQVAAPVADPNVAPSDLFAVNNVEAPQPRRMEDLSDSERQAIAIGSAKAGLKKYKQGIPFVGLRKDIAITLWTGLLEMQDRDGHKANDLLWRRVSAPSEPPDFTVDFIMETENYKKTVVTNVLAGHGVDLNKPENKAFVRKHLKAVFSNRSAEPLLTDRSSGMSQRLSSLFALSITL